MRVKLSPKRIYHHESRHTAPAIQAKKGGACAMFHRARHVVALTRVVSARDIAVGRTWSCVGCQLRYSGGVARGAPDALNSAVVDGFTEGAIDKCTSLPAASASAQCAVIVQ